jgi:CRISPR/Cas system-associated endonuclease Cas1
VALTPGGRRAIIATFERRLDQEITHPVFGYRVAYRRLFEVQARLLGRYLAGEIPEMPHITPR